MRLQQAVTKHAETVATLPLVARRFDKYWSDVCAPVLKARKRALGRKVPEKEIAAAVEDSTKKRSTRGLVNAWLSGKREPYISQFLALCDKMGADEIAVLGLAPKLGSAHVRRHAEGKKPSAPPRKPKIFRRRA